MVELPRVTISVNSAKASTDFPEEAHTADENIKGVVREGGGYGLNYRKMRKYGAVGRQTLLNDSVKCNEISLNNTKF